MEKYTSAIQAFHALDLDRDTIVNQYDIEQFLSKKQLNYKREDLTSMMN